jgi:hypothetical protein
MEGLVYGGSLAAGIVAKALPDFRERLRFESNEVTLFRYHRVFVRRMLSRYLRDLSTERESAVSMLLPFLDYIHGLPAPTASLEEFLALDRQWQYEQERRQSGREGFPMMEAMVLLEQAAEALKLRTGTLELPYRKFPFESFDKFNSALGGQLQTAWNPIDVTVVIRALGLGERGMFEHISGLLQELD